jgi:hypothetical protein
MWALRKFEVLLSIFLKKIRLEFILYLFHYFNYHFYYTSAIEPVYCCYNISMDIPRLKCKNIVFIHKLLAFILLKVFSLEMVC